VIIFDARSNNHPVPTTMARIVDHQVWGGDRDYYITVDAPRKKLGEDLWSNFKPWGTYRRPRLSWRRPIPSLRFGR
jgi:hypothetical protein